MGDGTIMTTPYGNAGVAPVLVHTTDEGEGHRCKPGIPHPTRGADLAWRYY